MGGSGAGQDEVFDPVGPGKSRSTFGLVRVFLVGLLMEESGLRIIYLASREAAYSRVRVLGDSLKARFEVTEILSSRRGYTGRIIEVLWRFIFRKKRRADVLVVGFLAQPLLPLVRLFWRGPIVSDAMISLEDTLIFDRRRGSPGGLLARVLAGFDRYLVRHSDLVLCDTLAHADFFRTRFGPTSSRFERLWVGAPDLPPGTPRWRLDEAEGGPLRVFFYGSFIPLQGTDVIMKAVRLLGSEEAVFRIAGDGPLLDQAKQLVRPDDPVTFIGWQTEKELIDEMLRADVSLGVFGASDKAARVIPNKAYSALQLGVPLLTGDGPGIRELLEPGVSSVVCPMNDPARLAQGIRWCRTNRDRLAAIGAAGKEAFDRNASPEALADLVEGMITALSKR